MTSRSRSPGSDFWRLWGAATASNLGDGIRLTALPLAAVAVTSDPLAVSAVTAASFGPWLFLALVGGTIADHVDRRRLIIVGQAVRTAAVAGFAVAVATGSAGLAAIYAIAVIIGVGEVVVDTAVQAAIPRVAGNYLDRANSRLTAAQFITNDAAGGPLGSVLYSVAPALPFAVDAVSFAIGIPLMATVSVPLQEPASGSRPTLGGLWADIVEGGRFLAGDRLLAGLTAAVAVSNLADAASRSLMVILVTGQLGGSELAFGLVIATAAVGGSGGAAVGPRLVAAVGRRTVLVGAFVVLGAGTAVMARADRVELVAVGSTLAMFAVGAFTVANHSVRQHLTPDRLLGRVTATTRLFALGAVPLGALGGGVLARQVGVRTTMLASAAVSAAIALLVAGVTSGRALDLELEKESG
ncbi:MAG: MFS transporter [Acidimicrobiales bacterium]